MIPSAHIHMATKRRQPAQYITMPLTARDQPGGFTIIIDVVRVSTPVDEQLRDLQVACTETCLLFRNNISYACPEPVLANLRL
eukprot:COSAG06_NODE_2366_length_7002_cov_11.463277_5_plen_83_part_00